MIVEYLNFSFKFIWLIVHNLPLYILNENINISQPRFKVYQYYPTITVTSHCAHMQLPPRDILSIVDSHLMGSLITLYFQVNRCYSISLWRWNFIVANLKDLSFHILWNWFLDVLYQWNMIWYFDICISKYP